MLKEEEVKKLKTETEKQLNYTRGQMIFWTKKTEQLTGSLAICNVILEGKIEEKKK